MKQGGPGGNTLIMYDEEMPSSYWAKNKKFSVDLRESSFATDRQLEDQRFLRDNNRNRWNNVLMKCDKTKSEKLGKLKKINPAGLKAKVLNKFVREASGAHNYALVPPITKKKRSKKHGEPTSPLDPDKNPYVDVYRKESSSKPVVMTFGHRPGSASRVFHPGTMKIRLRPGEIVPKGPVGKSGFGLTVVQLAQVLQAPKIPRPGEEFLEDSKVDEYAQISTVNSESSMTEGIPMPPMSPSDFRLPYSGPGASSDTLRSQSGGLNCSSSKVESADWGNMSHMSNSTVSRKNKAKLKKISTVYNHQVQWDESFHQIKRNPNEKFLLRASGLNEVKEMSLEERLKRFNRNASTIEASSGMCIEKRLLDLELQKPQPLPVGKQKKSSESLSDPRTDAIVRELEKQYHKQLVAKEFKERELRYKDALKTIPNVNYYPESVHSCLLTGATDIHDICKAQLSARSQTSDLTFSLAGTVSDEKENDESVVDSVVSPSKGNLSGVSGLNSTSRRMLSHNLSSTSSFVSEKALEINTGPYSKLKEKKKPSYRPTKKISSPGSTLNDYEFKYLDEALLNKPPPPVATCQSESEIKDLMANVDIDEQQLEHGVDEDER